MLPTKHFWRVIPRHVTGETTSQRSGYRDGDAAHSDSEKVSACIHLWIFQINLGKDCGQAFDNDNILLFLPTLGIGFPNKVHFCTTIGLYSNVLCL